MGVLGQESMLFLGRGRWFIGVARPLAKVGEAERD
jgi:hypothetical protein